MISQLNKLVLVSFIEIVIPWVFKNKLCFVKLLDLEQKEQLISFLFRSYLVNNMNKKLLADRLRKELA